MSAIAAPKGTTLLIVDTNILYTKNDVEIVAQTFESEFRECSKYQPLQLIIPQVVISELVFKKFTYAAGLLTEADKALRTLSRLTESDAISVPTHDSAKGKIAGRIAHWCEACTAVVVPTPFHAIDWQALSDAAVWHQPPFSPVENKSEKGFKDALILEVVSAVFRAN